MWILKSTQEDELSIVLAIQNTTRLCKPLFTLQTADTKRCHSVEDEGKVHTQNVQHIYFQMLHERLDDAQLEAPLKHLPSRSS